MRRKRAIVRKQHPRHWEVVFLVVTPPRLIGILPYATWQEAMDAAEGWVQP